MTWPLFSHLFIHKTSASGETLAEKSGHLAFNSLILAEKCGRLMRNSQQCAV